MSAASETSPRPFRSLNSVSSRSALTARNDRKFRLAIIAQHVVQYHAPLYRKLAGSELIEPRVFYLDRTGAEATFDASMATDIQWDLPLLEGYPHEFLTNYSPWRQATSSLSRLNPGVVSRLRRGQWDAVLVQGYQKASFAMALLAARTAGVKVLFRGETWLPRVRPRGPKDWLKRAVLQSVFSASDIVFYSCTGNRKCFEMYGCPADKLRLFPCAVDNEFFRERRRSLPSERSALRAELQLPAGLPIVLNVGRMDDNKRQADLLHAVARLQQGGAEVGVLLLGDGPRQEQLHELVRTLALKNVYFPGFVNQQDICRYYAAADIFALCSEYDASPKAVNEALNFELPIVCADWVGTVGDMIRHEDNALVYACGDVEQLSGCLQTLLDEPRRQRMGRQSLLLADQWSLDADVAALEDALQEICPAISHSPMAA